MAISSSTRKAGPFLGNDATTVFPFAFKVFAAADLLVVNTSALGVESDLELDVDYTVTLNADQDNDPGGAVTRLAALPTGERLTITSDVPALQPLVLTNNGGFYPRVINDAFDKITIIAQQLIEQVGRSLKLPISSTASATLPDPVANSIIAWNSDASGFVNIDPTDLVNVAAYSEAFVKLFDGDGVETDFELDYNPGVLANLDVSISGVTQVGGEDFTWIGTTIMFDVPPPAGTRIQVRYTRVLPPVDLAAATSAAAASAAAAAADRAQTGLDRVATAADVVQTGLDRVATAADRVQTGLDAAATAADRTATGASASAAAASATLAQAQTDYSLLMEEASPTGTDLMGVYRSGLKKLTLTNLAAFVANTATAYLSVFSGAVARTFRSKLGDTLSVKDFGAVGDGTTNDSGAFALAVASAAPSAVIVVPNSAGYLLDTKVSTGTKKIVWRLEATTITCPPGDFAFSLDSNGSQVVCAGRGSTIFKLRAPASALVMPTVTTARTAGALTTASVAGGSGFVTTPVAVVASSPAADAAASDAAVIATVSGGTVSSLAIVAAGADYASDPAVTFIGGGAGAVKINGVMGCVVGDFSIDFNNVANSVGVYHYGGWFADIRNIDRVFDVSTGVSSEHATSVGLVVDSHTDGVPGPTGSYGGAYVCRYSNLFFNKRALIGHDTSTGTTLQFSTCDFKNSYIHGCVGITEINPVQQAISGTDNYHLVNVDGLTLIGGDVEDAGTIFHTHGSCNNVRVYNTLAGSATGPERRGSLGTGWYLDWAKTTSPLAPLRTGSGGAAGHRYQNTGWTIQHGHGVDFSGDTLTIGATNIKPISTTQANLYDTSASGLYLWCSTGGEWGARMAYAGTNPVTTFDLFKCDASGVFVGANKVVGARGAAIANPAGGATVDAEARAAIDAILARIEAHGLIAT